MAYIPGLMNRLPSADPIITFKVIKNDNRYKIISSWNNYKAIHVCCEAITAKEIADAIIVSYAESGGVFGLYGPFTLSFSKNKTPELYQSGMFVDWENMTNEEVGHLRKEINLHLQKLVNLTAFF